MGEERESMAKRASQYDFGLKVLSRSSLKSRRHTDGSETVIVDILMPVTKAEKVRRDLLEDLPEEKLRKELIAKLYGFESRRIVALFQKSGMPEAIADRSLNGQNTSSVHLILPDSKDATSALAREADEELSKIVGEVLQHGEMAPDAIYSSARTGRNLAPILMADALDDEDRAKAILRFRIASHGNSMRSFMDHIPELDAIATMAEAMGGQKNKLLKGVEREIRLCVGKLLLPSLRGYTLDMLNQSITPEMKADTDNT